MLMVIVKYNVDVDSDYGDYADDAGGDDCMND